MSAESVQANILALGEKYKAFAESASINSVSDLGELQKLHVSLAALEHELFALDSAIYTQLGRLRKKESDNGHD